MKKKKLNELQPEQLLSLAVNIHAGKVKKCSIVFKDGKFFGNYELNEQPYASQDDLTQRTYVFNQIKKVLASYYSGTLQSFLLKKLKAKGNLYQVEYKIVGEE